LLFDGLYQACFPATVRNRYSQNFREIHFTFDDGEITIFKIMDIIA